MNVTGLAAVASAIVIYLIPGIEFIVLIFIMSAVLIINGIARITLGVVRIR